MFNSTLHDSILRKRTYAQHGAATCEKSIVCDSSRMLGGRSDSFFFSHILVQYASETNLPSELVLGRQKLPPISAETNDGIEKNLLAPPAGGHYLCKIKAIEILKVFGKERAL